jgi:hypothetical protein
VPVGDEKTTHPPCADSLAPPRSDLSDSSNACAGAATQSKLTMARSQRSTASPNPDIAWPAVPRGAGGCLKSITPGVTTCQP